MSITDAWLEPIGRMTHLQGLTIHAPQVSDKGLSSLADMTVLGSLELIVDAATGEGVRPWKTLPALRSLSLEGANFTSLEFLDTASYAGLTHFRLKCPKLTGLPPLDWTSLEELYRLELECPAFASEDLAGVSFPRSVKWVVFARMSLDVGAFACLNEVERLDRFVLRDCQLTSNAWEAIHQLSPTDLTLHLDGTAPPDNRAVAERLQAFTSVRIINEKLTDDHLIALAAMPELTHLIFNRCDLSEADVVKLGPCRKLENLHVWSSSIAEAAEARLRELLPECTVEVQ
jgi:hypothetical protein